MKLIPLATTFEETDRREARAERVERRLAAKKRRRAERWEWIDELVGVKWVCVGVDFARKHTVWRFYPHVNLVIDRPEDEEKAKARASFFPAMGIKYIGILPKQRLTETELGETIREVLSGNKN